MTKIQRVSSFLLIFFDSMLISIPLFISIRWFCINIPIPFFSNVMNALGMTIIHTPEGILNITTVKWALPLQFLGFIADLIGLLPLLISLIILKSLFRNYQKGEYFTLQNAIYYKRLGWLYLMDALFIHSLSETLMVLAATFTYPPGHCYLTISFGTPNLAALFYGVLIIVISWIMTEASTIYDEQKFTV